MDISKDFIIQLRRIAFDDVCILLCNAAPKLIENVRLLTKVKFEDGTYYLLYGAMKKIIVGFLNYFTQTMDEVIQEADRCINEITRDELLVLVEQTMSIHQSNQVLFGTEFLPAKCPSDKKIYEEIEKQFNDHMKKLHELKEKVDKLDRPEKVLTFAKEHFKMSMIHTSNVFNFAHVYMAMMMSDRLQQIRVSLEEIVLRMNHNMQDMQEECDDDLCSLLDQLYDKNKESLTVARNERKCSIDVAEVNRGIQIIKGKIQGYDADVPMTHLEEEVEFWQNRLKEFNEIADNLVKLKVELERVTKQERDYLSMRSTELPGTKRRCWETMEENYAKHKAYLKELLKKEGRALVTFFACRGSNRVLYKDETGLYFLDEYDHQVYVFEHGLGVFHISCDNQFIKIPDELYYFDKNGRYIKRNGKKLYQSSLCSDLYQLEHDNLLTKVPEDFKDYKSDVLKLDDLQCQRVIKDPNDITILPEFDPMEIKGTLDKETVKYLWDTFGNILPDALYDVGMEKSRNPIHCLAHKLLHHKYKRTMEQNYEKNAEAEEFKTKIYNERKAKAVAASRSWKRKQVPRRKPEESDDAIERAVYDKQMAEQDFVTYLNYYY